MKRFLAVLFGIACLAWPLTAFAEEATDGEDLLYNGDFSVHAASAALPAGWSLEAYTADTAAAYTDSDPTLGVVVVLENDGENDARVCQMVTVKPDTCYRLSAMISTADVTGGAGATLSIDNYNLDSTFCYSSNLSGTNEWTEVVMYVKSGPKQTEFKVALRLGGYGLMSAGRASFAKVEMIKAEPADELTKVIDLMSETGTLNIEGEGKTDLSTLEGFDVLMLCLLCAAVVALAYIYVYRSTLRYEGRSLGAEKPPRIVLPLMLLAAFMLRVVLSLLFYGHFTDINCFMAWGSAALDDGLSNFYTSGMFADYPPGYMYICAGLSWLCRVLGIGYGTNLMALVFKLPACIADLVSAVFVYKLATKKGLSESFSLVLAGLLLYCPVLLYVSGAWGQIDTVLTLGLVLVCWCLQREKRILAGALYGLAVLMKPQALMMGPLLAVAFIATIPGQGWGKRLIKTVLGVAAALAVLAVLSLPFQGTQTGLWLVDKYMGTVKSYPYASIEAFNLPALLGGNWKSVDMRVLGLPYRVWGIVFIILSVLACCTLYVFSKKRGKGALYLCGALMLMLIFTLGHYMHERYMISVLMLLIVSYIYCRDRRILIAFGAVGTASLLNVLCAFFVVNHQSWRGAFYNFITAFGSLAMVAACGYLAYVCWRVLISKDAAPPALALPKKQEPRPDGKPIRLLEPIVEERHWFTRRDTVYMLALTLVYAVVALLNLGSLRAPETYWYSGTPGETIQIEFEGEVQISEYWVFGNLANNGTLLISGGGVEETYTQKYDEMFRWDDESVDITTDRLELTVYAGALKINEIAFFDAEGKLLPVKLLNPTEGQARLFDEQDTVPEEPSYFNGMYFDELYHGRTAYEHLHNLAPYENSHPPLGKIFIMIGVAIFGMCPFGWRIMGALFGIGMLPILYCFGKRLFKNSNYALLAAGLFAFDFMHFTQTRIATIDVYGVFFILLMFYFMYRYMQADFFGDFKKTLRPLALAGLFFGLGAASKWICIYAGAGLAVLLFGTLIARYRTYRRVMREGNAEERAIVADFWRRCLSTLLWCLLFYIAVPFVIYFLSYLPYYIYEAGQRESYGIGGAFRTFWQYQKFMYNYHSGLTEPHFYASNWYSWPFTGRPMCYYFSGGSGYISVITASGNPAVWWVGTVGAIGLIISCLCRKVRTNAAIWVLFVGVLANYFPWVLVSRCTFIYHFFATVPFITLAAVYLLQQIEAVYPRLAPVKWVWLGVALLLFILLYPGLSGYPVSQQWGAFIKHLPGGVLMYGA